MTELRVGDTLHPVPLPEVSVYVHIPFCSSRCNYCDFYFETTRSPRVIEATLERLLEEAAYFLEGLDHPAIASVYFGGGTPSVVPPRLLAPFLERFAALLFPGGLPQGIEWTFEANPESVSAELLEVLGEGGVNRLSLGVQSFDDRLLRALTRRADRATVEGALRLIEAAHRRPPGFRLNIDLITGIPGQTGAMVRSDIDAALAAGADHFSVYSLTVEEHTPLRQAIDRRLRLMPSPSEQDHLWLTAREHLAAHGFEWYEISNFAPPGKRSEHNLRYWRLDPYLGLGPGGVSTLPMTRGGERGAVRLTNPNLFLYGSRTDTAWHHAVEPLDASTLLFEHFITGLRTDEGVAFGRIAERFGVDLTQPWRNELAAWAASGTTDATALAAEEPRLVLTPRARLALDRHLLEIAEWIDRLGPLPPVRWP